MPIGISIATAVQTIKEQREEIKRLTERIEKLEEKIVELYHATDDHVGSLWKCLDMDHEEYLEWVTRRAER